VLLRRHQRKLLSTPSSAHPFTLYIVQVQDNYRTGAGQLQKQLQDNYRTMQSMTGQHNATHGQSNAVSPIPFSAGSVDASGAALGSIGKFTVDF